MKLLNYRINGALKLGLKVNDGIIDLAKTLSKIEINDIPNTMHEIISSSEENLTRIVDEINRNNDKMVFVDEAAIEYAPCVNEPGKIICVGLNYRKHAIESNMPIPEHPILFNKFNNSLAGHKEEITISKYTHELDYEAELGIVIGKQTKDITEDEAFDHVFGYFTANDVSARDLQLRSSQWMLGKTSDGYLPVGPYLVPKKYVNDPDNLRITCTLNGEMRQDSNTADMIFSCKEIISYISKYITLEPGDIIITGTPEGVIMGDLEDNRSWLKDGDEVTISIEGLGSITNIFKAEK
ncbi:fumarylacetoacetate hydrolase family protein [Virgibacillus sp. W0430]|uniref:fumarylacetoacetate hydrolase family protein n=1 Tax=Virgibacillus sp. W0430 TaxID=3391580 RepID=UPI003F4641B4